MLHLTGQVAANSSEVLLNFSRPCQRRSDVWQHVLRSDLLQEIGA